MGERGGHEHQSPQHRGLIRPFDISSLIEVLREEVADGGDLLCGHAADALEVLEEHLGAEEAMYRNETELASLRQQVEALQRSNADLQMLYDEAVKQEQNLQRENSEQRSALDSVEGARPDEIAWSDTQFQRAEQAERRVSELEREKTESTKRWMDQTDKYRAALETAERRVESLERAGKDLENVLVHDMGDGGTCTIAVCKDHHPESFAALERFRAALSSDKDATEPCWACEGRSSIHSGPNCALSSDNKRIENESR